jgi:hypothetical protein
LLVQVQLAATRTITRLIAVTTKSRSSQTIKDPWESYTSQAFTPLKQTSWRPYQ